MEKKTKEKVGQAEKKKEKEKVIIAFGRRKEAIARALIKPGTGIVKINNIPLDVFDMYHRLQLLEPIKIAEGVLGIPNFDIHVNVRGGGVQGQTEAARLAIARAIVQFTKSKEIEKAFLNYARNLVDADIRRKEMRKPRDSKARAKRQKSYR
jgi:small subunit ribosomal protein S9